MQKSLIKLFSFLLPTVMARFAYKQLTSPQIRKLRANELETLDKAKKEPFHFKGFDIQTYHWPGGADAVLLIHGWEGQAGNFSDIVERLLQEGYSVFAFDGPSHGFSSRGETSLFEFSELVGVMVQRTGVKKLISHSFGGVATVYGLYTNQAHPIEKYLLLTSPDRFLDRIEGVAKQVGITDKVKQLLIARLEKETQVKVETLNVSSFAPQIDVKQALIIHDKNDKVIPIAQSKRIHDNWPVCDFVEIEGTGHFRILRTDFVIDQVVSFLNSDGGE